MSHNFLDLDIILDREDISKRLIAVNRGIIATINANIVVHAFFNKDFQSILQRNTLNICDGSILAFVLNKLNKTNFPSYPGPDFFLDIIKKKTHKHVFLGSTKDVLNALRNKLVIIDGNIENSLFIELPFCNVDEFNFDEIALQINKYSPDYIWVSLGAPKQEMFAAKLFDKLILGWVVSVGAAFDFYSGIGGINRAPKYIIILKLEWFYRLLKQPRKTAIRLCKEFFFMPLIILIEFVKKK